MEKKILYAIACHRLIKGVWQAQIFHCHASNQASARWQFRKSYPNPFTCKIDAIAPAVGFVEEKNIKGDLIIRA